MILLMTCLNFLSHGTQDLYPTFLRKQLQFPPQTVTLIAVIYNLGAIAGGLVLGICLAGVSAAGALLILTAALLSIPIVPFLGRSHMSVAVLAAAGYEVQFMVQGCWGVIPAHLNELSPSGARGTFPGFVYQLGNFLASTNATIQGVLAAAFGGFSYALGGVAVAAALAIIIVCFEHSAAEARDINLAGRTTV